MADAGDGALGTEMLPSEEDMRRCGNRNILDTLRLSEDFLPMASWATQVHRHHSPRIAAVLQSANSWFCAELLKGLEKIAATAWRMGDMESMYAEKQGGSESKTAFVIHAGEDVSLFADHFHRIHAMHIPLRPKLETSYPRREFRHVESEHSEGR
jgi:hypothetical protein